jgi:signal transduction histidine kinase
MSALDADDSGAKRPPEDLSDFSEVPRLELDQLLGQLIDRAQDVIAAQDRLRGLLRANRAIVGDLALPVVLQRIVEAARDLAHARYAALGVIAPEGGSLEQFIHVGVDEQTVAAIGHLPEGKGLLGALVDDPRPIRLASIADDRRSVGFPAHHPPMASFLGVPIKIRDEVYGNLYLTERDGGEFTAEDEELVAALAATAATAIENARLFAESRRRQDWLQASTEVTRQLLSSEHGNPLHLIAQWAREMAEADVVTVVLPGSNGALRVDVAVGAAADQLAGVSYPSEGALSGLAISSGRPIMIGDVQLDDAYAVHLSDALPVGPVMAIPLVGTRGSRGALMAGRLHGRRHFNEVELDMAMTFANHAAVALELADARADQQRIALLEDRDRIARDLHDHVIQRLFATGLTVQSVASSLRDDPRSNRLGQVIDDLDETIRQIRTSIFELRGPLAPANDTVRARVLNVVNDLVDALGFSPAVRFSGPVDTVIDDEIADDLVAVVREALTNTARHAQAKRADVDVKATTDQLTVEIIDDGIGIGDVQRRSGLANMRERAERHDGEVVINSHNGTHLRWTIPLR